MHTSREDWESSTPETCLKDTDELILRGAGDNEGQVKQIRTGSHRKRTRAGSEVTQARAEVSV